MCSISNNVVEWTLKHEHISELYHHLYDNRENGGEIILDYDNNTSLKVVTTNVGKSDSVNVPDSVCSFHIHPISCYKREKTIWGWPSGEDMRESIIYGMRGSGIHIVPSVEGTYTIQPNPCIIASLLNIENLVDKSSYPEINKLIHGHNWGNFLRGFVILAVEIYFRSTHVFRTIEYMKHSDNISSKDFVDFTNLFKLSNLFNKNKIQGCKNIKCNEISTFENNRFTHSSFEKYVKEYESDANIFYVTKTGDNSPRDVKFLDILKAGGLKILLSLNMGIKCNFSKTEWHTGRIFDMKLYPNKVKGDIYYDKLSNNDKVKFIMQDHHTIGDIYLDRENLKFKLFDMKGKCNYSNLQNHISGYEYVADNKYPARLKKRSGRKYGSRTKQRSQKKNKKKHTLVIIGAQECSHCHTANERANEMKKTLKFSYKFKLYPTIKEAIDEAQLSTTKKINSVPIHFLNGKITEDPYSKMTKKRSARFSRII